MRDQEQHGEENGARRVRSPSQDPAAPRVSGPPATLLALQRAAGNAAVARALEEERHVHHEGCCEGPSVQRSPVHDVLRSAGRPLEAPLRAEMEERLGADFGDVRVHTDTTAQRSAEELGARAYTSGNHVVIGAGGGDKHTLAHELTHVIQQRTGPVEGTDNGQGLSVSDPGDRFEREAEANARRAMAGRAPAASEPAAAEPGRSRPGQVAQRMEIPVEERDDFVAGFNPRNQVMLNATLNGVDLGTYASAAHIFNRATSDHAEDAIVDAMEALDMAGQLLDNNTLVITDLTASPCTTTERTNPATGETLPITSNKGAAGSTDGCTERLIELARDGTVNGKRFTISITCEHYYQPRVQGGKEASRQAVAAMQQAGIQVTVLNP
ncbi:DUF4157 domain-containing protein [Streptomyces sp.]|uniref:eCIS core domain-containing protein n=1 Tax=Streptomyces sp. TaxID=1931 RepID=UPI0039C8D840